MRSLKVLERAGLVAPVKMKENLVTLGLGKSQEYAEMTRMATSDRRKLESEVQETAEQVAAREAKWAKEQQIKEEVKNMQRAFSCDDCRTQYKTVSAMDNHLSSYDHHHTRRLRELQQQQKRKAGAHQEQQNKRKREHQQEEVMLRRRIAAHVEKVNKAAEKPIAAAKVGFSFGGVRKKSMKT